MLTGAGRPVYYAIDRFEQVGDTMLFFQGSSDELIYSCRQEGTWAVVSRKAVNIVTDADMAKHQVAEGKQVEAFYEKLDPEGWKEAQKMVAGGLADMLGGQGGHVHGPQSDDKPVPGQYL